MQIDTCVKMNTLDVELTPAYVRCNFSSRVSLIKECVQFKQKVYEHPKFGNSMKTIWLTSRYVSPTWRFPLLNLGTSTYCLLHGQICPYMVNAIEVHKNEWAMLANTLSKVNHDDGAYQCSGHKDRNIVCWPKLSSYKKDNKHDRQDRRKEK